MIAPRADGDWEIMKFAARGMYTGTGAGSACLKACIDYAKNPCPPGQGFLLTKRNLFAECTESKGIPEVEDGIADGAAVELDVRLDDAGGIRSLLVLILFFLQIGDVLVAGHAKILVVFIDGFLDIDIRGDGALFPSGLAVGLAGGVGNTGMTGLCVCGVILTGSPVGLDKDNAVLHVAGLAAPAVQLHGRIEIAEALVESRPGARGEDDVGAVNLCLMHGVRIGLVEADDQGDLAELRVEDLGVLGSGLFHVGLCAGEMYLAVLADESLWADKDGGVVDFGGIVWILLEHGPAEIHIIFLGVGNHGVAGRAARDRFRILGEECFGVLVDGVHADALRQAAGGELGEKHEVDVVGAALVNVFLNGSHVLLFGIGDIERDRLKASCAGRLRVRRKDRDCAQSHDQGQAQAEDQAELGMVRHKEFSFQNKKTERRCRFDCIAAPHVFYHTGVYDWFLVKRLHALNYFFKAFIIKGEEGEIVMYCPNCGKEVPDGGTFCPSCGAKLNTPVPVPARDPAPVPQTPPAPNPAAEKKKQRVLWIVFAAVVVVIAIVFGVIFGTASEKAYKPCKLTLNNELKATQQYVKNQKLLIIDGDNAVFSTASLIDYRSLASNPALLSLMMEYFYNDDFCEDLGFTGCSFYGFNCAVYAFCPWILNGQIQGIQVEGKNKVDISFDVVGQQLTSCQIDSNETGEDESYYISYSYDAYGNLTEINFNDEDTMDVSFEYTTQNHLESISYTYNDSSVAFSPSYNANGQISSVEIQNNEGASEVFTNTYQYQDKKLSSIQTSDKRYDFTYSHNRLTQLVNIYKDDDGKQEKDIYTWTY